MINQNQVMTTADLKLRLKRVRTSFSRLGEKWIQHYNTLHKDIIRFLLYGAKPELRGLFFHWMRGKDICAFLDYEEGSPLFSDDESAAILCHLEMYASFHPSGKGHTARTRIARNRRYASELAGRVGLCRAMLAEEQRNIASAPYDARLLKRLDSISRFIRYDETDDLRKELAVEADPYLRWILESVLGQPVSPLLPEEESTAELYSGTLLEQLAQQCRVDRNLNRRVFRTWACQAMAHKIHYFYIEELAILLIGVKKYHWDFREEPHQDECMPLAAWRERADEIISRQGTIERLEMSVLAAKIAAFIAAAEELDPVAATLLAQREPDPLIRECLDTAVAARNGHLERHRAIRNIESLVADALYVIKAELDLGILLYAKLTEPESDDCLHELIGNIPDRELELINLANFADQALEARVAWCRMRYRTKGMLSLEFLHVDELQVNNMTHSYFSDLEPYRLLGSMVKFYAYGSKGSELAEMFNAVLPIHLRAISINARLLTASLTAWINGTPVIAVTEALECCLMREEAAPPQWAAKNAYGEQWDLQEMKCFYFGGMHYPKGFMTERRRGLLREMEVNANGTVGVD